MTDVCEMSGQGFSMSAAAPRRFICRLIVLPSRRAILRSGNLALGNLSSTRALSVTHRMGAKKPVEDEEVGQPIKFSTSKASHRTWTVERSFGSTHQRPWWKVLPITVAGVAFLLWCVLREETEVDETLDKPLHERLPGILSEEEEQQLKSKPS
ncbi:ubiquinol-cytochrome c reductase complex assembly factor 4 [Denticeps clupeoides]|uniref:Uncharacterized protein n=1 Tax=Denticeps clupeoides TaxID=299321 RepID=A0AAY4AII2_9TELE|nr:protein CCSMST1 [Denticeps clupeoides]